MKAGAAHDVAFMAEALRLARRGRGTTWPNPMVGALVVRDGQILGRGYHVRPGEPHAEVLALREAGERARGATCYVTLEPCSHHGRTPPCAEALLGAGISTLVYGTGDPNPLVAGDGLARLGDQGVELRGPVLEAECNAQNYPFIVAHEQGRAALTLKLALTLDGMVADRHGKSQWITGPMARRRGHELRAANQAVLVGEGTVLADDPRLTPRDHGGRGRDEVVRVVASMGKLDLVGRRLLEGLPSSPVWVLVPEGAEQGPAADSARGLGVDLIPVPVNDGGLDLRAALCRLKERDVIAVLCEGGAELASALLRAGLVDRLHLFRAPIALGRKAGMSAMLDLGADAIDESLRLRRLALRPAGPDTEEVLVPDSSPWLAE